MRPISNDLPGCGKPPALTTRDFQGSASSYQYDAENRIVEIDAGLTNDATFVYDPANRRVKRVEQGYTTYSIREGSNVIAEYSNRPQTSPGGRKFYHADRLSNRLITDGSGVVKGASDDLPFGDEGGRGGEGEKHRYTSYERDRESGTDYAINRQYSQVTTFCLTQGVHPIA